MKHCCISLLLGSILFNDCGLRRGESGISANGCESSSDTDPHRADRDTGHFKFRRRSARADTCPNRNADVRARHGSHPYKLTSAHSNEFASRDRDESAFKYINASPPYKPRRKSRRNPPQPPRLRPRHRKHLATPELAAAVYVTALSVDPPEPKSKPAEFLFHVSFLNTVGENVNSPR